jgi:Protein of unknown function (DUF2911)
MDMRKRIGMFCVCLLTLSFLATTVMGHEAVSPHAKAQCAFANGKTVTVAYSSPRMRGRKIFGGLVPYGEVWRTGANEAATFVPSTAVIIGGKSVPAGSYTLFTIPNPGKWILIISKATDNPYPGPSQDFVRIDMDVSKPSGPSEAFTIGFDKVGNGCSMHLDWETTRASVEIVPGT